MKTKVLIFLLLILGIAIHPGVNAQKANTKAKVVNKNAVNPELEMFWKDFKNKVKIRDTEWLKQNSFGKVFEGVKGGGPFEVYTNSDYMNSLKLKGLPSVNKLSKKNYCDFVYAQSFLTIEFGDAIPLINKLGFSENETIYCISDKHAIISFIKKDGKYLFLGLYYIL